MLRSIGKQSRESVESVLKKTRKATVNYCPHEHAEKLFQRTCCKSLEQFTCKYCEFFFIGNI